MVIILLQLLAFLGYVAYVWKRIGVQKSISDSWYQLPTNKNLFIAFTAGVGLPMWAYSLCGFNDYSQFVFAISGFFMFCIGIASMFKANKMTKYIHFGSTFLAIGFALWGIYAQTLSILPLILIIAAGSIPLLFVKHKIWWIEIWIFAVIIIKIFTML